MRLRLPRLRITAGEESVKAGLTGAAGAFGPGTAGAAGAEGTGAGAAVGTGAAADLGAAAPAAFPKLRLRLPLRSRAGAASSTEGSSTGAFFSLAGLSGMRARPETRTMAFCLQTVRPAPHLVQSKLSIQRIQAILNMFFIPFIIHNFPH